MLPSSLKARSWMAKNRSYLGMAPEQAAAGLGDRVEPGVLGAAGVAAGAAGTQAVSAPCFSGSFTGKKPAGPAITLWWVLPRVWSWNQMVASSWTIGYV